MKRIFSMLLCIAMLASVIPAIATAEEKAPENKEITTVDALFFAANRYGSNLKFEGDWFSEEVLRPYGPSYAAMADAEQGAPYIMTAEVELEHLYYDQFYVLFDYYLSADDDGCVFSFGYHDEDGQYTEVLSAFGGETEQEWIHHREKLNPGKYELVWTFYCQHGGSHYVAVDDVYVGFGGYIDLGYGHEGESVSDLRLEESEQASVHIGNLPVGLELDYIEGGSSKYWYLSGELLAPGTYEFYISYDKVVYSYLFTVLPLEESEKITIIKDVPFNLIMDCSDNPDTATVVTGKLPKGTDIMVHQEERCALFYGIAEKTGVYSFTVEYYVNGYSEYQEYIVFVHSADEKITLPDAKVGEAYKHKLYEVTSHPVMPDKLYPFGFAPEGLEITDEDAEDREIYYLEGVPVTEGKYEFAVTFNPHTSDITIVIFEINVKRDYILYEDFEDEPEGWKTVDADGDGHDWMPERDGGAYEGMGYICSYSWDSDTEMPLTPDNWLISPAFLATSDAELYFSVVAMDSDYADEKYSVYVLPEGYTDLSAAVEIKSAITNGAWEDVVLSLGEYAGQNIHIAFRHHDVTDMYCMAIDLVKVTGTPDPEPEVKLGDVTGDDVVNTGDAVLILRSAAGLIELTEAQLAAADTAADGKVNTGDAVAILKYSAGIITEF
ncbi:MAG: choice-of-anchor J domain-containing protein [Clostridia bacterium]|nr:choice-of-anchor J domain-containing protein [Clostridia bacterium]